MTDQIGEPPGSSHPDPCLPELSSTHPRTHLYTAVLGKAAPASAELASYNSAILLRSKVSLRKIASDIEAQTAAKASGLFPKTPIMGWALV